jgi:phage gp29-like protein
MKLYDAYGREVETAHLREEQAAPTFAGIRNIYSVMHPSAGLTPERLTAILRDAEAGDPYLYLELAEEMEEKDLHYLAVLSTRKQSVAQLDMIIRAASSSPEDQKIAALVREVLLEGTLPLESVLFDILDAIGKGFSAVEIIWNTAGRTWFPERLIWRDPRWFLFDWVNGETLLLRTMGGETEHGAASDANGTSHFKWRGLFARSVPQPFTAPLWPFKFIVHVARAKAGLPIRGGLARAAGWAYLFKNYVLKDWVTFTEVFGQPLRVGKYGPGATENDKRVLLNAVTNIGTDAGAVIPDSMVIEFTEARQSGSADLYERFCDYLDRQVSKAVLGQTLTTEMPREGGGSRAAAQVHQAVRRDIMGSDARRLSATITQDLVRPLVELNFGPQARYPQFILGLPDDQDVKVFADTISELADRGLRVSQKTVLDKLGLPEPQEGEPILASARSTPASGTTAHAGRG